MLGFKEDAVFSRRVDELASLLDLRLVNKANSIAPRAGLIYETRVGRHVLFYVETVASLQHPRFLK